MDAVDPNPPFPSRGVAGLPGNEESFDENNRWNTKHQNTNSRLFFCKEKLVVDFLGIFLIFLYVIFFICLKISVADRMHHDYGHGRQDEFFFSVSFIPYF